MGELLCILPYRADLFTLPVDAMQLLLPVLAFSTVCFLMAYGTQKRTRWAWHGGWVFGFLAAGAVVSLVEEPLRSGQTTFATVCLIVFGVGGACVWTFWARFWIRNRADFFRKKARR